MKYSMKVWKSQQNGSGSWFKPGHEGGKGHELGSIMGEMGKKSYNKGNKTSEE